MMSIKKYFLIEKLFIWVSLTESVWSSSKHRQQQYNWMQCSVSSVPKSHILCFSQNTAKAAWLGHRHHTLQQKCLWPILEQHLMGSADNPLQSSQLKEGWLWGKERSSEQMDLAHINGFRPCSHFLFIQYDLTPLVFNTTIHTENGIVCVASCFTWFCAAVKFHGD